MATSNGHDNTQLRTHGVQPARKEAELTEIQQEVLELKKERNAVILAHNYQVDEIQRVADYVGDSLGLAYRAEEADADCIVFCGVHFMAETAKIVNPNKPVLLPDMDAGCSLSRLLPRRETGRLQRANPDTYVVAYINCSAAVKALSDVICTSGNAMKIVEQVPADRRSSSFQTRILASGSPSRPVERCSSGKAPVTPTSSSPSRPSSASSSSSQTRSSSRTQNASRPSATTPTKSAAPKNDRLLPRQRRAAVYRRDRNRA